MLVRTWSLFFLHTESSAWKRIFNGLSQLATHTSRRSEIDQVSRSFILINVIIVIGAKITRCLFIYLSHHYLLGHSMHHRVVLLKTWLVAMQTCALSLLIICPRRLLLGNIYCALLSYFFCSHQQLIGVTTNRASRHDQISVVLLFNLIIF